VETRQQIETFIAVSEIANLFTSPGLAGKFGERFEDKARIGERSSIGQGDEE
jgi:hypothetical protein